MIRIMTAFLTGAKRGWVHSNWSLCGGSIIWLNCNSFVHPSVFHTLHIKLPFITYTMNNNEFEEKQKMCTEKY